MKSASFLLLFAVLLLFSIGLLMIFNTTSAEILDRSLGDNTHAAMVKQILYGMIGFILALLLYRVGYQKVLDHSFLFFLGITIFLILVFIPPIGLKINGGSRWVSLGGIAFQPSEAAKYLFPLVFIHQYVKRKRIDFLSFVRILLPLFLSLFLILLEPDNGTAALLIVTMIVLFFVTRIPYSYWAIPFFSLVLVGGTIAYHMPHVKSRIAVYMNPEKDLRGKGHQPHQAKIAAGSGGLTGKGLGESLQKLTYLPEARSDYIAAIFAEEFGFLGMLGLISLYMTILFSGTTIAMRCENRKGFYTAAILTFLLSIQAFVNLGVVSNLLPSKGTTLPFISQGGSALITSLCALGLILSVAKDEKEKKKRS